MGNLGEEIEEREEREQETEKTDAPVMLPPMPDSNFVQQEFTQEQLQEMFIQQDPEGWEAAQLKMRYLDALGRKRSGQKHGRGQQTQARQVIAGNSRAARRMFKRKSGKD